jgi:hypothetical protein
LVQAAPAPVAAPAPEAKKKAGKPAAAVNPAEKAKKEQGVSPKKNTEEKPPSKPVETVVAKPKASIPSKYLKHATKKA